MSATTVLAHRVLALRGATAVLLAIAFVACNSGSLPSSPPVAEGRREPPASPPPEALLTASASAALPGPTASASPAASPAEALPVRITPCVVAVDARTIDDLTSAALVMAALPTAVSDRAIELQPGPGGLRWSDCHGHSSIVDPHAGARRDAYVSMRLRLDDSRAYAWIRVGNEGVLARFHLEGSRLTATATTLEPAFVSTGLGGLRHYQLGDADLVFIRSEGTVAPQLGVRPVGRVLVDQWDGYLTRGDGDFAYAERIVTAYADDKLRMRAGDDWHVDNGSLQIEEIWLSGGNTETRRRSYRLIGDKLVPKAAPPSTIRR